MTIKHHPSDTTLATFAGGQLDPGSSAVVSSHLASCQTCQRWVATLENLGGVLLADLPATPMVPGSLTNTMGRLNVPSEADEPERVFTAAEDAAWLPEALRPYKLGPWRWLAPGVYQRKVDVPSGDGSRVFLLKAAPGTRLPVHIHTGVERTQVLAGAFTHDGGRFGAGDFDDAEGDVEHRPSIDPGEECICLVAMTGDIKMTGPIGRVIQPLLRL